jgi:beta-lactamase class A
MLTRRMVMSGAAMLAAMPAHARDDCFARLETEFGGRLGVAARDTGTGKTLAWRGHERFAMCSTFKFLLAAAVLQRIDRGTEQEGRLVRYDKADLIPWSPVTEKHIGEGLSIGALVEAILTVSDNTAANLLLAMTGGPQAWTAFARSLGDKISRLDRIEPALNSAIPGDKRDTTTPEAMLADLQNVLTGDTLTPPTRQRLIDSMANSTTGVRRLKAGLPPDWRIASKTGTGENGATNDIAALFPPGRAPIFVAAYYTGSVRPGSDREKVLAEVGRIVAGL